MQWIFLAIYFESFGFKLDSNWPPYSTKTELLIHVLKTKIEIEIARPKRFTKVAASATNYARTQGTTFGAALFTE